mgnify:CR=1 FL=1
MPSSGKNLTLLFIINVFAALYMNIAGVFIPLFIRSLKASVFEVSLALFIGNTLSTIMTMVGGHFSDKYGRKRTMILSGILWLTTPLLFISTRSWPETVLYNAIGAMALSFFIPSRSAMIMDSAERSMIGRIYGLMNISWPIGGIVGPFIGGVIADKFGWSAFFLFLSVLASLYTLMILFLTESKGRPVETEGEGSKILSWEIVLTLFFFVTMHVLANTSRGIMSTIFPFYLTERFGKTKTEVGVFFSVGFGVATLISQIPGGILADKLGRKRTMVYSTLPLPFLSALFLATNDYLLTLLLYLAITSFWSTTWPASTAYIMDMAPSARKGFMVGIRLTSVRLGFTIGPLIGGFLWDNFNVQTIFYVLALLMTTSFLMALLLKERV